MAIIEAQGDLKMNSDLYSLLAQWYDDALSNVDLYHFVQEYGEVKFFLELPIYLDYEDGEMGTYQKLSIAYYRARKYFEEH